ncbi:MAG: TonB-dependent receptor plug domain-containing protein, partial [Acidobacteriota bacterium]
MRQLAPLLILCLIAPAAGGAEATGAEPDEAPSLTTFYGTATVRERPVTSATSAVTVLDRAAIEATGARTLSELLRFVPGLDITTGVARGSLATAQIRGGDPNYTRVLLDGIPLNDGTYQVGDVFDLTGLPVLAIERLEVVRGPLSSFYGSTGLAGAINIITRRGQSASSGIELAEGELEGGDASLRRAGASLAGGSDRAAYFVGLSWEEESERVADESFSHGALHANLDLQLGPTSRLRLSSRFADWDAEDYPDASGGPVFGSGELRDAQHSELSLGAELLLGKDEHHKVTASVYHHALDR